MEMNSVDGVQILIKAIENDKKDKLYQQYCHMVVFMNKDNYVSFDDFYKQSTKRVKKVTKQEAYSNAENILKMVCKG